ncbi:MAG: DUF1851 domain-containing protein [Micrococcales bacterium]|nr:DUF1851 domain-containing protein [Micrococcales bacterium]
MVFESFTQVAAVSQAAVDRYGPVVPPGVVQAWHEHGAGFVGDGYFRFVDPVRAHQMLGTDGPLPAEAVVLFATAMADLVAWYRGMFLVVKCRLGQIHAAEIGFEHLVSLMVRDHRDGVWQWQPYPQAQARLGTPGFEDCLMHVPLLGLGGRGEADQMQTGSLWIHVGLITQLVGPPRFTHMLPLPTSD